MGEYSIVGSTTQKQHDPLEEALQRLDDAYVDAVNMAIAARVCSGFITEEAASVAGGAAVSREEYLIADLTRYRDRLKEIHEKESDIHARRGASYSRVDDTLSTLAFYHGLESEVGKLIEEIRIWLYECQFHDKPVPQENTAVQP